MPLYRVEYSYDTPEYDFVQMNAANPAEAEELTIAYVNQEYANMRVDPMVESIEEIKETV